MIPNRGFIPVSKTVSKGLIHVSKAMSKSQTKSRPTGVSKEKGKRAGGKGKISRKQEIEKGMKQGILDNVAFES